MKRRLGFTLIELLIGAAVVVILFTLVLANFRSPSRYQDIDRTLATLQGRLRGIQIMSSAGQRIGLCTGAFQLCQTDNDCPGQTACGQTTPDGGFGLTLSVCSGPGACDYIVQAFDANGTVIPDPAQILETYSISAPQYVSQVYFSSVEPLPESCPILNPVNPFITDFQIRFPTGNAGPTLGVSLTPDPGLQPEYMTAILTDAETGQAACIYFSRLSGVVGTAEISN